MVAIFHYSFHKDIININLDRRDVLRGIAAGGLSLSFAGLVGANGNRRYLMTTSGEGPRRCIEDEGFTVVRSLACGDVLVVSGAGSPGAVQGVDSVTRDVRLRLETPVVTAAPETTRDETHYERQWDKQVTNVAEAHQTTTGGGTTVAVVDTGSDLDHPDLASNLEPGVLFRRVAGRDDAVVDDLSDGVFGGETAVRMPADPDLEPHAVTDADGQVVGYDPDGFDVETRDASDDVDGHGSHVAGITAASVDESVPEHGTGIAGTAPDATVVPIRVFYWELREVTYETEAGEEVTEELVDTFTTIADLLAAIDYAARDLGVDAMNMSIGTPPLPPQSNRDGMRRAYRLVIKDAVNAGSVIIVSAGNSGTELNKSGVYTVPNSVPGAVSVGATGPSDERAFYSNYGTNELELSAPGGGYETPAKTYSNETEWPYPTNLVYSTTPDDVHGSRYAYFAGTSMAAPQVTGAAALVSTADEGLHARQVANVLARSAEKATGRDRRELGAGRLDVAAAVETASGGD